MFDGDLMSRLASMAYPQGSSVVYTYDAWNRLVKVEDQGVTPAVVGAYGYDGLNRRITRTIGSDDPIHEYYTESWQRIESRPGGEGSTTGVSLFVFGIRYIDDIIMRQRDANASGPPEERRYYLTDANYNVAMIVTDAGYGVERVFYTAYGEPEVFPFGDADGDYDVDTTDQSLITDIKNGSQPYNILADLNLDGAVTQADLNAFSAYSGALGGRNVLTASKGSATTGNDIGYAGYTWNDERSQWHVRHREYDPKMGRFLQRDPVGHSSGSNFYQYAAGSAATLTDAAGLSPFPPSFVPEWTLPNFTENGTDMASEPPPPTYWGMLLGPGFDPSLVDWDDTPFPDIFNPLIAPGFDPGRYCKPPGPRYMADRGLVTDDELDRAVETAGRYGAGFATLKVVGRPGDDNPYYDYLGCMANCLAEQLGEMPLRLAAKIFGRWVLGKKNVPLSAPISVDPNDPWLSDNPASYVSWSRVLKAAGEGLQRPRIVPGILFSPIFSIEVTHRLRLLSEVSEFRLVASAYSAHVVPVVIPPSARAMKWGNRLIAAGRWAGRAGWVGLGWDTLTVIYDAYNECDARCRDGGGVIAE